MKALDFRQMEFSETKMVEALEKLYTEGIVIERIILTRHQHIKLLASQPTKLIDWETGGTYDNPVFRPAPKTIKTIKIYSSPFGDAEIVIKKKSDQLEELEQ